MNFLALGLLLCVQALPGYGFVRALRLGLDEGERLTVGFVLAGPLGAGAFAASRWLDSDRLYWALNLVFALVGVILLWIPRRGTHGRHTELVSNGADEGAVGNEAKASAIAWRRVLALVVVVVAAYGLSAGRFSTLTAGGELHLDRSLQRDTLFHIGIVRSLVDRAQPTLLSFADRSVGYHVGYHLQLAAWSRHLGIDAMDGLLRWGPSLQLSLLVLTAFGLGRRFVFDRRAANRAGLWAASLVFGTGLGFAFFFLPGVDWWSLVFMDATLVSVFLPNPLLPALVLLFVSLSFLKDDLDFKSSGARAVFAVCGGFLVFVKMFMGVQLLVAVVLACVYPKAPRTLLRSGLALVAAMALPLVHTFAAANASNTSVTLYPFELVRYSMEKLGFRSLIDLVAAGSSLSLDWAGTLRLLALVLLWVFGFLGLRLVALSGVLRGMKHTHPWWRAVSWFALMGFPISLLFRIAPADARDFSRLEAQNDIIWFATQSGVILWFFVAGRLSEWDLSSRRRRSWATSSLILSLAFVGTVQHFVHQVTAGTDRVSAERVEAAGAARDLSERNAVWLSPPDRVHPSWVAYWAGRPVVYDSYVGYDYMFVGRPETEYRRHAVAQFWRSPDVGFRLWLLRRFRVSWVWEEKNDHMARNDQSAGVGGSVNDLNNFNGLGGLDGWLDLAFENTSARLWRVRASTSGASGAAPIRLPDRIPMSRAGALYLGDGFSPPTRRPARRSISSNTAAVLYVPHGAVSRLAFELDLNAGATGGMVRLGMTQQKLAPGRQEVRLVTDVGAQGLSRVKLEWLGDESLTVHDIRLHALEN